MAENNPQEGIEEGPELDLQQIDHVDVVKEDPDINLEQQFTPNTEINGIAEQADTSLGVQFDPEVDGFNVTEETKRPKFGTGIGTEEPILSFIRTTLGDVLKRIDENTQVSIEDLLARHGKEAYEKWETAVQDAMAGTAPMRDRYVKRVRKQGSNWNQSPQFNGRSVVPNRPRIGGDSGGALLTGERAILMMNAMTNTGAHLMIPLWDTGIWVTMRQPTLGADLEFIQRIFAERIQLGRESRGTLFTNESVFITGFLFDYCLAHIFDTTAKVDNIEELRSMIVATDITSLAWGMAVLANPQGFPFSQPCTANPRECIHVEEDMVTVAKMHWVDDARLTPKQMGFMASASRNSGTKEALKEYQDQHTHSVSNVLVLKSDDTREGLFQTKLVLNTPLLETQISVGRTWVNDIVQMTENAFGQRLSTADRDVYMANQAWATQVRKYSHWVKEIVYVRGESENRVTGREDIERSLVAMSGNRDLRKVYIDGIEEYIEDQGLVVIGFPNYECPACKKHHLTPKPNQTIVPIDPVSVFSRLQRYRLEIAQQA